MVKYANKQASVSLQARAGGRVCLMITDCGPGFDPAVLDQKRADGGGFGLFSIRERLRALGGEFRLDTAPGGSDAQLTAVNALSASVLPGQVLEAFRGWLLDVDVPDGLTVDTDLRWRLLHALVAHGAAGEREIDEELERDPTATGQRQAERARALIPTAEAKERAWQRAVHDDELPNAVQEAIIGGFSHPGQRGLLGPYVDRYFTEVAEVWQRRTSERAQSVVVGLFPAWAVDKATVEAADAWLADESHPPALRRLVSEGRAGIVRALAAREFDRS